MELAEFERLQYVSLREEIKETKARIFWIFAIGLFVLPGGDYLARTMDAPLVRLGLPMLVVCVGLLYLSENHALMRCGRYIRTQVESTFAAYVSWEEWLESPDACLPRSVDRYLAYAFYVLLTAYYLASALAAYQTGAQWKDRMPALPGILVGVYTGVGLIAAYILVANVRATTTTSIDTKLVKRDGAVRAA